MSIKCFHLNENAMNIVAEKKLKKQSKTVKE